VDLQLAVGTGGVTLAAVRDGLSPSLRVGFEPVPDVVGEGTEGDEVCIRGDAGSGADGSLHSRR
jgi:hypothetical protein